AAAFPLVGRDKEWAALVAAHAGATPDGRLVVLEGEPGVGKTRLAEELTVHVRGLGGAAVVVRCYEEEAGLAYGPLGEALRAAGAPDDRPSAARAGPAGAPDPTLAGAARLVPELAELRPGLPPPPAESERDPGAQRRLY